MIKTAQLMFFALAAAIISGCAGNGLGFSITEQEMTRYLDKSAAIEHAVGVENVMFARVTVDELKVTIGRADADRISVFANTTATVQMLSLQESELDLDVEFSAIPDYNQETGEVFMKSLRLEQFDEKSGKLTPEVTKLIKPVVALVGQTLSTYPVYKLDENKIEQALLKSTHPKLVVQGNRLVVDTFE